VCSPSSHRIKASAASSIAAKHLCERLRSLPMARGFYELPQQGSPGVAYGPPRPRVLSSPSPSPTASPVTPTSARDRSVEAVNAYPEPCRRHILVINIDESCESGNVMSRTRSSLSDDATIADVRTAYEIPLALAKRPDLVVISNAAMIKSLPESIKLILGQWVANGGRIVTDPSQLARNPDCPIMDNSAKNT
jgi:hypothetical protein